ncbi:ATP-dependent helicase [[Mycoplasma] mobile]|uniref:DNA 3'-5' helicase n=1 Tax=Mycoplasma mobile (strain ATCC 43663 / 163K / NCTC 11711) TaxID=267748 RepID=Q6KHF5_MYCM1|nr:UvrD-helicase domain-containing protein [[Mycoplasma] mobile]AAT27975.1 ATP-dependent DNA helicase [Mycoplasma mobile 163K]
MEKSEKNLLDSLNKDQKLAVVFNDSPLRIIAGAGSGKTRVLVHKIAYLIQKMNVKPYQILAVTFTNKAANEMKERIKTLVDNHESEPLISTFHALCVYILRRDIDVLKYPKNFTILDVADQFDILKNIYEKFDINKIDITLTSMINYISFHKINKTPIEVLETEDNSEDDRIKLKIYLEYNEILKKLALLDFNDLLLKTQELFEKFPEIKLKWSRRFKYILVDEFQDTSPIQYEIIKTLAQNHNLTIVGDPDQTIYSWRGANVNLILDFHKDFENAKTINLNLNYRSTEKILKHANSLIHFNKKRLEKDLVAYTKQGQEVIFHHALSPELEARWVVDKIKWLISIEKAKLSEISIIYRANFYSKNFEDALLRESIHHQVHGGEKFYERSEIKNALSYIKLLVSDSDLAFQRILNIPQRSIGNIYRNKILDYCDESNLSIFQAINNHLEDLPVSSNIREKLFDLIFKINKYQKIINENNVQVSVDEFFADIKYYDYLANEDTFKNGKVDNVKELLIIISNWFRNNPKKTFQDYFEEISLVPNASQEDDKNTVSLMNIHNCKGLEFSYVFLVGLSEEILPSKKALENDFDDSNLEEERRLAYVAITRAKKMLFLTDSDGYLFGNFKTQKKTSRFIGEMGIVLENENQKTMEQYMNSVLLNKQVDLMKDYQTNNDDIFVGDKIVHKVFGEGIVLEESLGQITVLFTNKKQPKTLLKNHASISKIIN